MNAITPTNTPTRRNRGGSPKQYQDLERINGTWTRELRERFVHITPEGTFHERIRALVEFWEQQHAQDGQR